MKGVIQMSQDVKFFGTKRYCENRLDIESMLLIAAQFSANVNVIDWDKWGHTTKAFMPFESLACMERPGKELGVNLVEKWLKENYPTCVPEKPEEADGCDVIWMPECIVYHKDGKYYDIMLFSTGRLSTIWSPALVAMCAKDHRIMVWDRVLGVWPEFVIEPFERTNSDGTKTYTHKAFVNFLRSWLPGN